MAGKLIKDLTAASGGDLATTSVVAGSATAGTSAVKFTLAQIATIIEASFLPASLTIVTDATANRDLILTDVRKYVRMTSGSGNTVTVPLNATIAFPTGSQINVIQAGAGQTTIVATGGVTVNATPGLKARAQFSSFTLVKVGTDEWDALGDLSS